MPKKGGKNGEENGHAITVGDFSDQIVKMTSTDWRDNVNEEREEEEECLCDPSEYPPWCNEIHVSL